MKKDNNLAVPFEIYDTTVSRGLKPNQLHPKFVFLINNI